MKVRKMRMLRHKYGISRLELGCACGLSPQRVSEIELGNETVSSVTGQRIRKGFEAVLREREDQLGQLRNDLNDHGNTLLELVEETAYEL